MRQANGPSHLPPFPPMELCGSIEIEAGSPPNGSEKMLKRHLKIESFTAALVLWSTAVLANDASSHRSPVDVALEPGGQWLVTANETANSVSLVRTADGRLLDEIPCGTHPADVEITSDGSRILVSGAWSGDVTILTVEDQTLKNLADNRRRFRALWNRDHAQR